MDRIDNRFNELRSRPGKKAFIAYITAGDPDLKTTERAALALEGAGVDILELGIPFSDPIADGPTIQAASCRALAAGATIRKIFTMVERLRARTDIPLVFMTYYNPILRYGLRKFFARCRRSGLDGVIVPDLPLEEADDLIKFARGNGVATIFLVSPTSTPGRMRDIANNSRGFIYYVSLTGVTGARRELPKDITSKIKALRSVTDKPVAVGFGVSDLKQARQIAGIADGVIVGSAIVKILGQTKNPIPRVTGFARSMARAVHSA